MNAAAAQNDQREEQSAASAIDRQVDGFFAALIPALTADELAGLERSLLREGCLAPLVVWKGCKILLDGHNRLALCRKHHIPFAVNELAFASREEAEAFIVEHQLGKRNLSPEAASYYRGKRYLAEKRMHGGNRSRETASGKNYHLTTAKRLAAVYKVAEKTIRNDGKFTGAVDAIAGNCGDKAVQAILARDTGLTRGAAARLSKMTPEEQQQAMEQLLAKGKIPRRSGEGESANVTLPREPTALAAKLFAKFGVEASSKVLAALSKLLQTQDEKA